MAPLHPTLISLISLNFNTNFQTVSSRLIKSSFYTILLNLIGSKKKRTKYFVRFEVFWGVNLIL